jgi:NDP-sugar pyrophosphorylase family protein
VTVLVLAADPELGAAAALRAQAARVRGRTCLLVATRDPAEVDVEGMLVAHRANAALLTIAVRRRDEQDVGDALIAGADGRLMAVQPSPHPDEALSELTDAGVYAIAPEAVDHITDGAGSMTGEVIPGLLAWDAPVYVHPPPS